MNDNCSGGMLDAVFGEAALDTNSDFYDNLTNFDHLFGVGEAPEIEAHSNCSISLMVDETALPVTVSVLKLMRLDVLESATFVCVGENGVTNLLNTSESVTIELVIHSKFKFNNYRIRE